MLPHVLDEIWQGHPHAHGCRSGVQALPTTRAHAMRQHERGQRMQEVQRVTANTVVFPCKIGDEVRVRDVPELKGRVVGLCQRVWGTTVAVIWWQDGRRHEEWLHDWEVTPC